MLISFDTKSRGRESDFIKIEDTPSRLISRAGANTKLSINEKFINSFNSSMPRRFSDMKSKHRKNSFLEKLKEKLISPPPKLLPPDSPLTPLRKRRSTNESLGSFLRLGAAKRLPEKEKGMVKFLKVEFWNEGQTIPPENKESISKKDDKDGESKIGENENRLAEKIKKEREGYKEEIKLNGEGTRQSMKTGTKIDGETMRAEGRASLMRDEGEGRVEYVDPTIMEDEDERGREINEASHPVLKKLKISVLY